MSAWGGIDLDDEGSLNSTPLDFDLEAYLSKLDSEPVQVVQDLQHALIEACQNGDDKVVKEILAHEKASSLVNIDEKDEAGSTALTYASCFGHEGVVAELLRFHAKPDIQDKNEWTALMWAVNNNHLGIVKQLLTAGADTAIKTSTGRTAFDLQISPSSATYMYLASQGYISDPKYGSTAGDTLGDAFYQEAVDPIEMEVRFNNELKESADALGGFGATGDTMFMSDGEGDADAIVLAAPLRQITNVEFDWSQFKVRDSFALPKDKIPEFLDTVITDIQPTLQKTQPPVSANALFLASRYMFYCGTTEGFHAITAPICRRIELAVQDTNRSGDLAYLSYWLANSSMYLYYLRKDQGLCQATSSDLQPAMESLVRLISGQIQEATHKLLRPLVTACLLNYDSIPEYGKVQYRDQWKIFKSSSKYKKEDNLNEVAQKHMLPPSYEALMKNPGPQRVTSVLSSLLFLFQIYGVHSVTQAQIVASLLYFVSSRMFNTIVSDRKYLNRRRAMQIRLNISVVEDWCRNHTFRPEAVEINGTRYVYKSLIDIGRTFLAPLVQILAWLQTFSGFGNDFTNVISTLQELKSLNPKQLLKTATNYRFETRESPLSKDYKLYLRDLAKHYDRAAEEKAIEDTVKERHQQKRESNDSKWTSGSRQASGTGIAAGVNSLLDSDSGIVESAALSPSSPKSPSIPQSSRPVSPPIVSFILAAYELPVADDILLDEDLTLKEHIPSYEEGDEFWGQENVTGINESVGARYIVPFISNDISSKLAKLLNEDTESESQGNIHDESVLEEPEVATKPPMDGEFESLETSTSVWTIDDSPAGVW